MRRSSGRSRTVVVALLGGVWLGSSAGCAPSCEEVCRKVDRCELSPGLYRETCEESCERQQTLYELDEDKELLKDFAAHRRCVGGSTCEEIEAGACYDSGLFSY